MTFGPGKYDDIATAAREKTNAKAVIVIVLDGDRGSGFSCQADAATTVQLPEFLEHMAREIRADIKTWW